MAEDTVDAVLVRLGAGRVRCRTGRLRLLGGEGVRRPAASHPDAHLAGRYGTLMAEIKASIALDASLAEPLVPGLRYLRAEAVYAVRCEMATTLIDVLARRTRAHLEDRAACLRAAHEVATLIAGELGWSSDEIDHQVAAYRRLCEDEIAAAGRLDARHATSTP
jgi:glycerol-3-phosphate dehydrogenase